MSASSFLSLQPLTDSEGLMRWDRLRRSSGLFFGSAMIGAELGWHVGLGVFVIALSMTVTIALDKE